MAREYLEKLTKIVDKLALEEESNLPMQVKHLFSGAALYVNGRICASWSPCGLAFKLMDEEVNKFISSGKAKPLKYFQRGTLKRDMLVLGHPSKVAQPVGRNIF